MKSVDLDSSGASAEGERLHPLQQAFVDHGAVQCGFCTPGLIMTGKALLDQKAEPTDDDIKHALKDTYCRCTGYISVINAIKDAARSIAATSGARAVGSDADPAVTIPLGQP